jgi:hypothetical protein
MSARTAVLADERLELPLTVRGVAPREAPLHARMAMVGLAVLVRHHPHHFLAAHLGLVEVGRDGQRGVRDVGGIHAESADENRIRPRRRSNRFGR